MREEELGMSEQSDSAQPHITHKKSIKMWIHTTSLISEARALEKCSKLYST